MVQYDAAELLAPSVVSNILRKIEKAFNAVSGKDLKHRPVMEKSLTFLEHQCGAKIPGKPYRMGNGNKYKEMTLLNLRLSLAELHSRIDELDKALFYTLEAREMLMDRTIE